jgi:hypothetical protein
MNQAPVKADRVAGAHRDFKEHEEDDERVPGEVHGAEDEGREQHPAVPD